MTLPERGSHGWRLQPEPAGHLTGNVDQHPGRTTSLALSNTLHMLPAGL